METVVGFLFSLISFHEISIAIAMVLSCGHTRAFVHGWSNVQRARQDNSLFSGIIFIHNRV